MTENKELCVFGNDHTCNDFHLCPYDLEINSDVEDSPECQCCEECEQECGDCI